MLDEPIEVGGAGRYVIRTYRGGDEMALISLWNQSLPQDTIHPRAFLTNVLCDPNFDPEGAIVAVNTEEEAIGFVWAVVRRVGDRRIGPPDGFGEHVGNGSIVALFVHPDHRRRGLGTALLSAAERFFRERGCRSISFAADDSGRLWPGLDREAYLAGWAFFESKRFQRQYTSTLWGRRLAGFAISDDVQRLYAARVSEGYQFAPLIPGYVVSVVTKLGEAGVPAWARLVRSAIAGETPLDQILLCTDADGRPVGVAAYGLDPAFRARVVPIGVEEGHRGKGLGRVLLDLCLDAMRSRGLQVAWASWPFEAPSLDAFMERAGFAAWREFEVLEKRLHDSP